MINNIIYTHLTSSSPRSTTTFTHLTTSLTPTPTFTTTSHHHERHILHTPLQLHKCNTSSCHAYHWEGPALHQPSVWTKSWLGHCYLVSFIFFITKSWSYLAATAHICPTALQYILQSLVLSKSGAMNSHRAGVLTYLSMAPSNIFSIPHVSFLITKWFWSMVSTFFSLLLWILDLDLY